MVNKLFLTFLLVLSAGAAEQCAPIATYNLDPYMMGGKKLTPFWSQEYVGLDLVRVEMRDIKDKELVGVAIFDTGFEREYINVLENTLVESKTKQRRKVYGHHGTNVANIINGPFPYGGSDIVEYTGLLNITAGGYHSAYKRLLKHTKALSTKIISNSVGWKDESTSDLSRELSDSGILWFLAAGNDHPKVVAPIENNSDAILIGSYGPSGLQSSFSQISNKVLVLAPADDMQASIDGKGQHNLFGGTSGATPLVATTVANMLSIAPKLKRREILEIIKRTALLSYEQSARLEYQPGLFNAYKAFKVTQRAVSNCNDYPCVVDKIYDDSTYDFAEVEVLDSDDCQEIASNIIELRKSALLTNSSANWNDLKEIYTAYGLTKNAEFFGHMATSFAQTDEFKLSLEQSALKSVEEGRFFDTYFRYQLDFGAKYQLSLASLLINDRDIDRYWASSYLIRFGTKLDKNVISLLKQSLRFADEELSVYIEDIIYL